MYCTEHLSFSSCMMMMPRPESNVNSKSFVILSHVTLTFSVLSHGELMFSNTAIQLLFGRINCASFCADLAARCDSCKMLTAFLHFWLNIYGRQAFSVAAAHSGALPDFIRDTTISTDCIRPLSRWKLISKLISKFM